MNEMKKDVETYKQIKQIDVDTLTSILKIKDQYEQRRHKDRMEIVGFRRDCAIAVISARCKRPSKR